MILYVKSAFNSAHLYHQAKWTEEKNRETFGRCFSPYGHGHNYVLEVGFRVLATTLESDKHFYQELVNTLTARLDHEHLNFVIPEFKVAIPTSENIALYFLGKIKAQVAGNLIHSVKLNETDSIWTEIHP